MTRDEMLDQLYQTKHELSLAALAYGRATTAYEDRPQLVSEFPDYLRALMQAQLKAEARLTKCAAEYGAARQAWLDAGETLAA